MTEAIQDAIGALEDERTVMDQKIQTVRDAVMAQIDHAIDTLRGLSGGAARVKTPKKALKKRMNERTNERTNARTAPARSAEPP